MNKWLLLISLVLAGSLVWANEESMELSEEATPSEISGEPESLPMEDMGASETAPAEEAVEVAEPEAVVPPKVPTFVVIVPERIDHDWYWILYSDRSQHIVQSAIERALIRAGVEVIDLTTAASLPSVGNDMQRLQTTGYALQVGKQLNADYIISGQATAVKASEGQAYGVNVVRTQAEVSAKIIRARDGKILAVEDASMLEGGQSAQAAGQNALKKAGTQIGSKLARTARELAAGE